jgi:hypothetical protein
LIEFYIGLKRHPVENQPPSLPAQEFQMLGIRLPFCLGNAEEAKAGSGLADVAQGIHKAG